MPCECNKHYLPHVKCFQPQYETNLTKQNIKLKHLIPRVRPGPKFKTGSGTVINKTKITPGGGKLLTFCSVTHLMSFENVITCQPIHGRVSKLSEDVGN